VKRAPVALLLTLTVLLALGACASPAAAPSSPTVAPAASKAPVATSAPAAATTVPAAGTTAPAASAAGVAVSGLVAKPGTISLDDMKAKAVKVNAEHPKTGKADYEGMRFSAIATTVQPKPEAKSVVLKAKDGFTNEVQLTALNGCADCMLALGADPNPDAVMPGMASSAWVKDIVSLEFK
jgi:hypothetical protein